MVKSVSKKKLPATKKVVTTKKRVSVAKNAKKSNGSKFVPFISIGFMGLLFIISAIMLFRTSRQGVDGIIIHNLQELSAIFKSVNAECKIIGFEHEKNYVDFLTVKSFVGSEVGAMNVEHPKNWNGPYLNDNPTIHQQQYIVLKNKAGYYLVPGDGVVLANGKVVGKDLILNKDSDIEEMLEDSSKLKSEDGALAIKMNIGRSFIGRMIQS